MRVLRWDAVLERSEKICGDFFFNGPPEKACAQKVLEGKYRHLLARQSSSRVSLGSFWCRPVS